MTMSRSAEPCRRGPYSADLRWRVVWQRIALDLRFEDIARNLNIAVGTAYNIFKLFQDTGEVDHKKPPKREHKLDSHHELYILGFIHHCNCQKLWIELKRSVGPVFQHPLYVDYLQHMDSPERRCNELLFKGESTLGDHTWQVFTHSP